MLEPQVVQAQVHFIVLAAGKQGEMETNKMTAHTKKQTNDAVNYVQCK